jgi:hypothetical protein
MSIFGGISHNCYIEVVDGRTVYLSIRTRQRKPDGGRWVTGPLLFSFYTQSRNAQYLCESSEEYKVPPSRDSIFCIKQIWKSCLEPALKFMRSNLHKST